jgi:hypothetical protein
MQVTGSSATDIGEGGFFTVTANVMIKAGVQASLVEWQGGAHVWNGKNNALVVNLKTKHDTTFAATFNSLRLEVDKWHFVGVSYDKTTKEFTGFLDGRHEVVTVGYQDIKTEPTAITFGKRIDEGFLNGGMSCVMLFNLALTSNGMVKVMDYCKYVANDKGRWKINLRMQHGTKLRFVKVGWLHSIGVENRNRSLVDQNCDS